MSAGLFLSITLIGGVDEDESSLPETLAVTLTVISFDTTVPSGSFATIVYSPTPLGLNVKSSPVPLFSMPFTYHLTVAICSGVRSVLEGSTLTSISFVLPDFGLTYLHHQA